MKGRSTVQTDSSASGRKLSTSPICSFPSGSHHWIWTVKLWSFKCNILNLRTPLQHLGSDCRRILYTEAPLPDDARRWPQASDKTVWLIPTGLHHVAWQSQDQLVMLVESKGSYFRSHCKALSHEFGFPGISRLIQTVLKLSHELGHLCLFFRNSCHLRTRHHSHLEVRGLKMQNKNSIKKSFGRNHTHVCGVTRCFFLSFRCKWNIFQPVNCGELLADVIERQDVCRREIAWIGIKNHEWPLSSPLSSNQFAFSHMQIHTLLLFRLCFIT